jgi:hypothetical protein
MLKEPDRSDVQMYEVDNVSEIVFLQPGKVPLGVSMLLDDPPEQRFTAGQVEAIGVLPDDAPKAPDGSPETWVEEMFMGYYKNPRTGQPDTSTPIVVNVLRHGKPPKEKAAGAGSAP